MQRMQRLKGTIVKIEKETVVVADNKSDKKFYFLLQDLNEAELGQKVDLLINVNTNLDGFSKILVNKKQLKPRTYKIANFSTLIRHMIKTRDRLQATLNESPQLADNQKIIDQIEWLNRGIDLFS